MSNMEPATDAAARREIRLRYTMLDGVLQIDVRSAGLEDDPNLIAMHLQLALDRLRDSGETQLR